MAHAHARECRADIPRGPWQGKRAARERARRGFCSPGLGPRGGAPAHEGGAGTPRPAPQLSAILPAPAGDLISFQYLPRPSSVRDQGPAHPGYASLLQLRLLCWSGQELPFTPARRGWHQRPSKDPTKIPSCPTGNPLQVCPDAGVRVPARAHCLGSHHPKEQGTQVPATRTRMQRRCQGQQGMFTCPLCSQEEQKGVEKKKPQSNSP